MPWAQFEEKEFEAPLYNQLEMGHRNVWSPGQVFEKRIGFDRGALVTHPRFWKHIGILCSMGGTILANVPALVKASNRSLPDFRMNLFIQAKRCERVRRTKKDVQERGISSPCYRFWIDEEQHDVLASVAATIGNESYVCYAAPAFHTYAELFRYTRHNTVIDNSTFPSASDLTGHEAWYFNRAGAEGVADSEPRHIKGDGLYERIQKIVSAAAVSETSTSVNLTKLAKHIIQCVDGSASSDRRSSFFFREMKGIEVADENLRALLSVDAFARAYEVEWLVLG